MKRKLIARQRRNLGVAACGLLMGAWAVQSCSDDVLTGQPAWLGNSIYERLQEDGNYTTLLRLIDDLGQTEVLSHTGSKTLFAANDSAFQQWFGNNSWGVNRYEELTLPKKKLLLNNAMINNAYLIELLSNVSGTPPLEGMCMRRETAVSIYDSVGVVKPDQMPNTAAWKPYKDAGKSLLMFKDGTSSPMIHFLPAYMHYNKITSEDLSILTNHQATDANEAWVNGKKIVERDITCKNGYIHKVDGVIESTPNMAEILRQHPNMSKWSELIDRFSAPYFHANGTTEYNRLYHTEDSVYTLRYYSKRSLGGEINEKDPSGEAVSATLSFDPGWNHYMYANTMGYDLHYDAGAMIVPTNAALEYWWENEGKDLQTEYGCWDSIPDATLAKLINVNMLPTFSEAVPSKFGQVLNDAKEPLGITVADVDSCFMGCNGVVYLVNKVFSPAEYASVAYPALAHESTMNVIYWAIDNLNFLPYLLSMDARYSLLLPTNDAMLCYIDPYTYGAVNSRTGVETPTIMEFYYDRTKTSSERVQFRRWTSTVTEQGEITKDRSSSVPTSPEAVKKVVTDFLTRLMDQLIIVGDVEDGHEYYKTKGGTLVRVTRTADGRLAFSGGWQLEHQGKATAVNEEDIYTKTNGKSYQLNGQLPMAAQNSVYLTLKEREEFKEFYTMLSDDNSGLLDVRLSNKYTAGQSTGTTNNGNKNLNLLDNYNYTVYAPTNESIRQLIDRGLLPTWDDYRAQTRTVWGTQAAADSAQKIIKDIIVGFLRYHIHDHSVAVNMASEDGDGNYANDYESMKRNPTTGRFYPLKVDFSGNDLVVTDVQGNQRRVVKTEGLYNRLCREYWFEGSGNTATTFMASDAVLHQIDGVLLYEEMKPWKDIVNEKMGRKIL